MRASHYRKEISMANRPQLSPEQLELQTFVPKAIKQTSISPNEILHSGNCGVIIQRSGQVANEMRNQARECALEICEHTAKTQKGFICSFLYEETFGQQDRIHWLIHLRALGDYMRFHRLAHIDPAFGEIFMRNRAPHLPNGGDWTTLFSGVFQERVLTPHFWGANASFSPNPTPPSDMRVARFQTTQSDAQLLHTGNSRMIIMREAQVRPQFRSESRVFARAYADYLNQHLADVATVMVYEQHFGAFDRLHWLIHLDSYEDYQYMTEFMAEDGGLRNLMQKSWVEGQSQSGFAQLFVEGSVNEVLLCPQHPTKDF
jgi:hypothetical protein